MKHHYNSYRKYLQERFGKPILKIVVNGGFSCPNRDGLKSREGCSFCDNRSFSPVATSAKPVLAQLQEAALKAPSRAAFIAYLQPFSNTYGDVKALKNAYEPLISFPRVVGLAIGTRPDCFTEEIYNYLEEVSSRTYLSVEIGLQSAHDETLALHNRGHTVDDFRRCVASLSKRGIETVAHVMLGLPPETPEMMLETAREIARQLPPATRRVGVFVDATVERVMFALRICDFSALQFHGQESPAFCRQFSVMKIKAFRVRDAASLRAMSDYDTDAFLLDSQVEGKPGGTGETFDWSLAVEAKKYHKPIFLAGGLTPRNVAAAIRAAQPFAVDVSSGVEAAPGKKDRQKMRDFVAAVRATNCQ